jgi:hypothetical protein
MNEMATNVSSRSSRAALAGHRLCNYPGRGFVHMTEAEWQELPTAHKGSWSEGLGSATGARHQVRVALVGPAALTPVFLTDADRIDPIRFS